MNFKMCKSQEIAKVKKKKMVVKEALVANHRTTTKRNE